MKDIKQLFESDLLNEETRQVLQEAFDSAIQAKEAEVEAKFTEQLDEEKTAMTSVAIQMVEEAVAEELEAISEQVTEARTLEVRYAEKLQDFKDKYDEKMQEQIAALVSESVSEELDELKEDIEYAKKHQFAMSMFESFQDVYAKTFGEADLSVYDQLEEAQKELDGLKRDQIMNSLLEGVTGSKRTIAETILEGVKTENLEARFESIRPVLLKESETAKEDEVVTESAEGEKEDEVEGTVVMEGVDESERQEAKMDSRVVSRLEKSLNFARGK